MKYSWREICCRNQPGSISVTPEHEHYVISQPLCCGSSSTYFALMLDVPALRFNVEFHLFFTALSVRPGKSLAITASRAKAAVGNQTPNPQS